MNISKLDIPHYPGKHGPTEEQDLVEKIPDIIPGKIL